MSYEIPINIETNAADFVAKMEQSESALDNVGASAEIAANKVASSVAEMGKVSQSAGQALVDGVQRGTTESNNLTRSILQLRVQMDSYKAIAEKATDPSIIEKYNQKIVETAKEINRLKSLGLGDIPEETANAKVKFDGLQNSINQLSRELPAFTVSAQTGFLAISNNIPALADNIVRLRKENATLSESGQKGTPVWKQLVGSLFSWNTALSLGITLITVYGKDIANFVIELIKGKGAAREARAELESFNAALSSAEVAKARKNIIEVEQAFKLMQEGTISQTKALDVFNEKLGDTFGRMNDVNSAQQAFVRGKDAFIKATIERAQAEYYAKQGQEKINDVAKRKRNGASTTEKFGVFLASLYGAYGGSGSFDDRVASYNSKKEKELEDDAQFLLSKQYAHAAAAVDAEKSYQRADGLVEAARKKYDNAVKKRDQAVSDAERLKYQGEVETAKKELARLEGQKDRLNSGAKQTKANPQEQAIKLKADGYAALQKLDDEYRAKSFDSDGAEIEALKNKFKEFRKIIVEENKRIADLNKKAGKGKQTDLIDISRVAPIEEQAVSDLKYRQETKSLLAQLAEQSQIYAEYEKFKSTTNEKEANKRYTTESINFKNNLSDQISVLKIKGEALNGVEKERLAALEKLQSDQTKQETKDVEQKFIAAYEAAKTFAQKIAEIDKNALNQKLALGDSASPEQLVQIDKVAADAKSKLSAENLVNTEDWKNLFTNLDNLTAGQIENLLANIEANWNDLAKNINPVDLASIRQKLQEARTVLIDQNPFREVGKAIQEIFKTAGDEAGSSAADIKTKWQNLAKATNKSFDFVINAVQACEPLKDTLGETGQMALGMLSNIAGASIGVVTAVSGAVKAGITGIKVLEQSTVILAVIQAALVAVQAIVAIFDAKDKRIQKSIEGHQNAVKQLQADYTQLERAINKALGEDVYKANLAAIANLKAQQEQLKQAAALEAQKKKSDKSKIADLNNQAQDVQNKIDDLVQKTRDELVGTTAKDLAGQLADSLVEAFAKGEDAAKAWGDVSKKVLADLAKSALKKQLLEKPLQNAIDTFLSDLGYKDGQPFNFKGIPEDAKQKLKNTIDGLGKTFTQALGSFDDIFADPEARAKAAEQQNQSGVSGAVKGITEQQADLLAGQFGGATLSATRNQQSINPIVGYR